MGETSKKEIVLAIETTQMGGSVSLLDGSREIGFLVGEREVSKSSLFLGLVEKVLFESGLDAGCIGLIVVSDGPGSQTGIRIGKSVAKGLSDAFDIGYCGVGLLDALRFDDEVFSDHELSAVLIGRERIIYRVFEKNVFNNENADPEVCSVSEFPWVLKTFIKRGGKRILIPENLWQVTAEIVELKNLGVSSVGANLARLIGRSVSFKSDSSD